MGFTFDDVGSDVSASPLSLMRAVVDKNAKNAERIRPYIGGSEVNSTTDQSPHRFVIDFAEMSEEQASDWPDLLSNTARKGAS